MYGHLIILLFIGTYKLLQQRLGGVQHIYNILWLQCLCTSSTTCNIKELLKNSPISNPSYQNELKIGSKSSYVQFFSISKQLVSLVRLTSTYPLNKSVSSIPNN